MINRAARLALGLVIAACTGSQVPPPTPTHASSPETSTPASNPSSAIPSLIPIATTADLPDPGGTCAADQLVAVSSSTAFPGYAALGYAVVFVQQRLRNAGEGCLLQLPGTIGVADEGGDFQPVPVKISIRPTWLDIAPGQSISIILGASWWLGASTDSGTTAFPPSPCEGKISDVSRVEFPLASGRIQISWDRSRAWRDVCTTPTNITVTVHESVRR